MRDAGMLGPDMIFSHCNDLFHRTDPDDEMWAAMKDNDVAIASCPVDELGMAHGNPVAIDAVRRRVTLDTVCRVGDTVAVDGQALVMTTSTAARLKAAA